MPGTVSLAVCVELTQPPAGLTYTYAALLPGAPATIVSPSIATDVPNACPAAPSEAVSLAVCVAFAQPDAGFVNT